MLKKEKKNNMAAPMKGDMFTNGTNVIDSPLIQNEIFKSKKTETSDELLNLKRNNNGHTMEELLLSKKNTKLQTEPKQTFKPPPSSVLSQVKKFLPVMAEANTKLDRLLQEVPATNVDIEHVDNVEGPVIEMDIALGVLDDSSSEDDISDTDSDISDNDGDFTEKTETNLKLPRCKQKQPYIEEITKETDCNIMDSMCIENQDISDCDSGINDLESIKTNNKEPNR